MNRFKKILSKFVPLIIILFLSGCATVYNPATGKKEFIFIDSSFETIIGRGVAVKIAQGSKFVTDPQQVQRLAGIGGKIAAVSDRQDLKYRFNIIDDKEINAFTVPGGYVYVNSGLMEKAADSELACVVGHEVGHIAGRHIAKKMQPQIAYSLAMDIIARKADIKDVQTVISIGYDLASRGYSRKHELEADMIGVKYAYKAGYDPYAMISFLKKMEKENKKDLGLVFLRTHPYPDQRIKQLEQQIPLIISGVRESGNQGRLDNKAGGDGAEAVEVENGTGEEQTQKTPMDYSRGRIVCSECGRRFSRKINFCPYDGARLKK